MRNKLIITIIILVIGLVWWGCENEISPTEPLQSFNMETPALYLNGVTNGECVEPPEGMVGWWTGDNTMDDIVSGYNGSGTPGYVSPGKVVDAFSFLANGSNVITVTSNTDLQSPHVTVDLWVKSAAYPGNARYLVSKGGTAGCSHASWALYTSGGGLRFYIGKIGGGWIGSATSAGIWDNNWHHVAGSYDGAMLRLYIDGNEVGTGTAAAQGIDYGLTYDELTFGNWAGSLHGVCSLPYSGNLDEIEIFNRALAQSEIAAIYNAGSAGKCQYVEIVIDIKPGSDPNSVNCQDNEDNGVIPVAILTTPEFDALTVDQNTVLFGKTGIETGEVHDMKKTEEVKRHEEDVDGDGDTDLVFHFRSGDTGIICGDTEAILTGSTIDGTSIMGTDFIQTVP